MQPKLVVITGPTASGIGKFISFIFKKEDEHPNTKGTIYQSTKGYA